MCDRKATMVVRLDDNGDVVLEGEKILVGEMRDIKLYVESTFEK